MILARGGSAADAAIAANAVMGVVEPMSNGIGGDLFVIYQDAKTGQVTGLNSSGPAPAGLSVKFLQEKGIREMPQLGIHAVSIPGCTRGWRALHAKYGKLPWADLFKPAIYYAEHGFPLTEIISGGWQSATKKLSSDDYGKTVFLPAPKLGQVHRNPDLAQALRAIAADPDALYTGAVSKAILAKSAKLGGRMTAADLAAYQPEWVKPLSVNYRGWNVYEIPPNSQGIAALEMLRLMERFPLPQLQHASPEAHHIKMEAQKLAYQDLRRYVGDPRFAKIPVEGMLSDAYIAARAKLIDPARANCDATPGQPPLPGEGDTIYMSTVDADGNIVSLIQSLYQGFGSGVAVDGYGFHLHNRAGLFTLEAGHPNELKGGKRPFHTIIPALMERDGVRIGFGIMGGLNQAQAHAQFVSNVVDHGMNIQAALEAPRFTKQDFIGCEFSIENRVPEATRQALEKLGHKFRVLGAYSGTVGGGQAVQFNVKTGVKQGASSPRKDGAAIPQPDPY
jgi:gamma-glutamyltranspeptidase/glutathione hydrolase